MDRNYTYRILQCLYEVHSELGPGLLESIYEEAAAKELTAQGFRVERQVQVPVMYKGERLANDLRLDLIVDDTVILELKSVAEHRYTYLVLKDCEMGYVVNFNEESLRDGIYPVYNSRFRHGENNV